MPTLFSVPNGQSDVDITGVTLGDARYNLRLRWNDTDGAWYMDVRRFDDGSVIAIGLKVVLGVYVGRQSTHDLFLQGAFIAIDTSGQGQEAGLNDLGTRVQFGYWLLSEIVFDYLSDNPSNSSGEQP